MKHIKNINPVLVAILLYSTRILYFGATFADAPVLAILSALYFGVKFIDIKKLIITENNFRSQVNNDISSIKTAVSALSMKQGNNPFQGRR